MQASVHNQALRAMPFRRLFLTGSRLSEHYLNGHLWPDRMLVMLFRLATRYGQKSSRALRLERSGRF